jgi:hypothetical protein
MFLLYHSEGCNICGMEFHKCYINDLRTTTCSGMLGHLRTTPFYHGDEGDDVDGGKGQLEAAPATSPCFPCSIQIRFVYSIPRHEIAQRVIYIVNFRLSRIHGGKEIRKGSTRWEMGPTLHVARK